MHFDNRFFSTEQCYSKCNLHQLAAGTLQGHDNCTDLQIFRWTRVSVLTVAAKTSYREFEIKLRLRSTVLCLRLSPALLMQSHCVGWNYTTAKIWANHYLFRIIFMITRLNKCPTSLRLHVGVLTNWHFHICTAEEKTESIESRATMVIISWKTTSSNFEGGNRNYYCSFESFPKRKFERITRDFFRK